MQRRVCHVPGLPFLPAPGARIELPLQPENVLHQPHGLGGHSLKHDLAGLSLAAQAGGQIGDRADNGIVPTAFGADAADGGAHWGATVASNAAFTQRIAHNGKALMNVQPTRADRLVGVKVATAPTAAQAGTLGVTLIYRAA